MTIRITSEGTMIVVRPAVYLGGDKFQSYRTATAGARFDSVRKAQVTVITKLPVIVERLRDAGFALDIAPDVRASLGALTAQTSLDIGATVARADAKDTELASRGRALYPFQKTGMAWLTSRHGALLADEMGLGKQQPIDTRVLTPSGWRAIGCLEVGDLVIGSNGKPTKVTGVFPQGIKRSYRVHFSDHSTVEAGPEHLWTVAYRRGGKYWDELVLTTDQLRIRPMLGKLDLAKTALYLPMLSAPVEFMNYEKDLPLDGYTMGALIANGGLAHGSSSLTFNTADTDVIRKRVNIGSINVYGNTSRGTVLGAVNHVRALELDVLSGEKFIPRIYMIAKVPERIALLQGLMDGDGSCTRRNNRLTYHTTSPQLACDVRELVEGLGGIASVREYNRSRDEKPTDYQVRIRLPRSIAPFSIPRKLSRYKPGCRAAPVRTVTHVEYVRDVESVCIAVEAENHLYVTEHCILTHNTVQTLMALPELAPVLVVCPAVAKGVWKREAGA